MKCLGKNLEENFYKFFRGDSASIKGLSLDFGNDSLNLTFSNGASSIAVGVEVCENCIEGYEGLSCQNAMEGFCRKRNNDYLNNPDDFALVGKSVKCACNGHSINCDPETCRCNVILFCFYF